MVSAFAHIGFAHIGRLEHEEGHSPSIYDYSSLVHIPDQVAMRLIEGVMWDHNGTYIGGVGYQFGDHQVSVEVLPDGNLTGLVPTATSSLPAILSAPGSPQRLAILLNQD